MFRVSTIRNSISRESLDHKTGSTQGNKVKQKERYHRLRAKELNTDDCAIYGLTFLYELCASLKKMGSKTHEYIGIIRKLIRG